jgi:hypothetical protein
MAKKGKVVHCKKEFYDVYIGRGPGGAETFWGNPYIIGKDGTRAEVIQKYKDYVLNSPEHMARLKELEGKILACWCHPAPCHGDVLVTLANKPDWPEELFSWSDDEKVQHEEKDNGMGYCIHCNAPTRSNDSVSTAGQLDDGDNHLG